MASLWGFWYHFLKCRDLHVDWDIFTDTANKNDGEWFLLLLFARWIMECDLLM